MFKMELTAAILLTVFTLSGAETTTIADHAVRPGGIRGLGPLKDADDHFDAIGEKDDSPPCMNGRCSNNSVDQTSSMSVS